MYFSTGAVADLVIVPLLLPPSEVGSLIPDPELLYGIRLKVALGLLAVDPSKVISGTTRLIKAKLLPSSMSNWAEDMLADMAAGVVVSLSSTPFSCSTRLLL